jgi:NADH dehydrogenase
MKEYIPNIPETGKPRIVVVGSGFAGLKFIRKMVKQDVQIVLLDKNNYHQFQPLLYQVATSGLEPSSISFPIRKILQKQQKVHFRIAVVEEIIAEEKEILTDIGYLKYDHLVLAMGATTNFFGNESIARHTLPMKSATDAILIRYSVLDHFENALLQTSPEVTSEYLTTVLVGGGPTGVEMAGALAEMKKYIFPKDYPDLDLTKMKIVLYEASGQLLSGMSASASRHALEYLEKLGVEVHLNTGVTDYDGTPPVLVR